MLAQPTRDDKERGSMPRREQPSAEQDLPNSGRISENTARALREAAEYLPILLKF
jgi:hypothetical protein